MRWSTPAVLIAALTATISIRASEREFTVRGTVTKPLTDGAITVSHEAVADYMPAMTMPFNVDPGAQRDAGELHPGDRVEFKLHVAETSRADDFKRLGRDPLFQAAPPSGPRFPHLREGDTLPPFALTDQDGHSLNEADLRGNPTLITFIFTRCPVPDFCPRLSAQFRELQRRMKSPATPPPVRLQLVSITLDPQFDTPAVLKTYGEHYGADSKFWRFATGDPAEIERLRKAFAVFSERKSAALLDHSLATALVGPDLRVLAIWRGNRWKPAEVLEKMSNSSPAPALD